MRADKFWLMVGTCPPGASHHFNRLPPPLITLKLNKLMCRVTQGVVITVLELSIKHMVAACQHICQTGRELKKEQVNGMKIQEWGEFVVSTSAGAVHRYQNFNV